MLPNDGETSRRTAARRLECERLGIARKLISDEAAGIEQSLDAARRLTRGVCYAPVAPILVPMPAGAICRRVTAN